MVVEKIYYSLDFESQKKLDIDLMKEGSVAPDKVFHNTVLHHYPPTHELSLEWLEVMNDSDNFSYAFGVLSHYVSDSFSAPHCVSREPSSLHSDFDSVKYVSKVKCGSYTYDLNESLNNASIQGVKDWTEYVLSYDEDIAKKEIDEGIKVLYGVLLSYGFKCNEFETKITKRGFYISKRIWIYLLIVGLCFFGYYIFSKTK